MADNVVVRKPGEAGDAYWVLGGLYEVLASGDETGGAMTVMQMTIPEGMGPPPHTHDGGETVYVLEGTVRYHIGDETVEAGPGSFFHIPKGTWENFEPAGTIRVLVVYTPGGLDKFFAEVGERAPARELPPPLETPPDLETMREVGTRYGLEMRLPG
ncbi:cupin domain-containing protein [Thermoactinospora rubra]|uniref:cupin domain-containing protein n=1 Tax=Thermoactinospora rubra TaxID=1088767 RepID=UPI000A0F513A|nr:cupin domain-containing protein [Thermoactinospora rubra]